MLTPTNDQLREASDVIANRFPDEGTGAAEMKLKARAEAAAILVSSLTFRTIAPITESTVEGEVFEDVPAQLEPLAVRAVALMVNRELVLGDAAIAEQIATGRRLRGFSAGPYSESYFAPGEFARRGAAQGRPPMDPDEELDASLWALATQEAREYFIAQATGVAAPAGTVSSFDYRQQAIGDAPGALGRGVRGGGPDGF